MKITKNGVDVFEINDSFEEQKIAADKGYAPVIEVSKDGIKWESIKGTEDEITMALSKGYKTKQSNAPEQYSETESGLRGAGAGLTFGFDDELGGAVSMVAGKDYTETRDRIRQQKEGAKQQNPFAYGAGEFGGAVATSFVPGLGVLNAAKGAKLAATVGKGVLQGGIYGLGSSDAEDLSGAAKDVAVGAALGGAGGAAGKALGVGASKAANSKTAKALEKWIDGLPKKLQTKAREKAVEALNPILSQQERLQTSGQLDKVGQELLDNNILKNRFGLPTASKGIYENLQKQSDEVGAKIGGMLDDAQDSLPDFRVWSADLAEAIRENAVIPNKQGAFWKGAEAVAGEADKIESWDKLYTLPELNVYKSDLGKRIKTWGNDNLSDKKVYEDMYRAVNDVVENKLRDLTGRKVITGGATGDAAEQIMDKRLIDAASMSKQAKNDLAEKIELPLKDFKSAKASYGALETAEKIAKKTSARDAKNNDIGLTTWIAGLSGAVAGGPAGAITTGLAVAGLRGASRAYGNQTAALLLDKLSKSGKPFAKIGEVLANQAKKGPDALRVAIFVMAKNNPEFNGWLNDNSFEEDVKADSKKFSAREGASGKEEAGLEDEGFFDAIKPFKQGALSALADRGVNNLVLDAADMLIPDSPLGFRPSLKGASKANISGYEKQKANEALSALSSPSPGQRGLGRFTVDNVTPKPAKVADTSKLKDIFSVDSVPFTLTNGDKDSAKLGLLKDLSLRLIDDPKTMTEQNLKALLDLRNQARKAGYSIKGAPEDNRDIIHLYTLILGDKARAKGGK